MEPDELVELELSLLGQVVAVVGHGEEVLQPHAEVEGPTQLAIRRPRGHLFSAQVAPGVFDPSASDAVEDEFAEELVVGCEFFCTAPASGASAFQTAFCSGVSRL